jgi:hypothetical protein
MGPVVGGWIAEDSVNYRSEEIYTQNGGIRKWQQQEQRQPSQESHLYRVLKKAESSFLARQMKSTSRR